MLVAPLPFICIGKGDFSMVDEKLVAQLLEALERAGLDHDIDVVDVEVAGSSKAPIVRVRIDHAAEDAPVISLDEVAAESGWIGEVLDLIDPFPNAYTLEVSSPGMDRPLRRARDFERFAGEQVQLVTKAREGRRKYTGELCGLVDGKVCVVCDDGTFSFEVDEISRCTIKPDFKNLK